jgi:predicted component of viral defense system (DUF524 family)
MLVLIKLEKNIRIKVTIIRYKQIVYIGETTKKRFDRLDDRTRRTLSRVDKTYTDLLQIFTNEAKEGPRLFSFVPVICRLVVARKSAIC